ncbi:Acetyltransferase (GNAT) domain-containing protein [Saccharopolyspora kobensis]|uniref:Acetyltransferase (GNAT) domain-containing protein n=1 Tax=Saccharopolyspora kobensis TaxID=146035 RepID=A0A1H6E6R9_9PSEU|nr:GNAT family N-acetyltransferase [Saccharopolyspora kobensis]SEG92656.1 Acetyltransferase (GNAT) domain-containing protein [Saccharopolyspora kobensis]SFD39571.1 Acetyltransferase (GNAT) family protein [Saccharopolyspora kobensis]
MTGIDPDGFVTGPHRVDAVHPDLAEALAGLWARVTAAGGAAGFSPTDSLDELRAAAAKLVEEVRGKQAHLITIGQQHVLVGIAVLRPRQLPVRTHTGELVWLAVDPALQGRGWGKQLHDAALVHAQAIGLEMLDLVTRSGHGLERFYAGLGWVERGRWPGAVRVAPGDDRDEIWFTRDVGSRVR